VKGLSGAQFIRDEAYGSVVEKLTHPDDKIVWLPASDPNQVWGKALAYDPSWQFTSVPGTVVALKQGIPVAVFERKGHTLRVFDERILTDALAIFVEAYRKNHIFSTLTRVTVKDYPTIAKEVLIAAGFVRVMMDYVLHR
jgi:ATP-dependent Lhr-like helicase